MNTNKYKELSEKVILKYSLEPGRQVIPMPADAIILDVQMQGDTPQMWAILDTAAQFERARREFMIVGTGQPFELEQEYPDYIGTFQMGALVWHVFEMLVQPIQTESADRLEPQGATAANKETLNDPN